MTEACDISVIVQGPLVHGPENKSDAAVTRAVLASVREHLPGAELVLSTWEGSEITGLDFDQLVTSKDPGALGERNQLFAANLIRQIVSSENGLARGKGTFALKLRTDTLLTSDRFIHLWQERHALGLCANLFQSKVLVSTVSTPRPLRCARPYWVSDFLSFGRMEDLRNLRNLWSSDFSKVTVDDYLPHIANSKSGNERVFNDLTRPLTPEQILVINLLTRHGKIVRLRKCGSINPFELLRSERVIASHFIPVDPTSSGFLLPEKFRSFRPGSPIYRDDSESTLFLGKSSSSASAAWLARFPEILYGTTRVFLRSAINRLKKNRP
jgi:hypothetical protein